ncbi:MAG: PAS domain S-box protein [Nitrososphaeria archaeon]
MEAVEKSQQELIEIMRFTENLSVKIHGILDEAEIYRTVREEFAQSKKYSITILLTTEDGMKLKLEGTSLDLKNLSRVEKLIGLRLGEFGIDLNRSKIFGKVVREGKTFEVKDDDIIKDILPSPLAFLVSKLLGLGGRDTVLTPLYRQGKVVGVLAVSTPVFEEYLMPTIINLSKHVSASLELVDEYTKLKKAEEELRVERDKARQYLDMAGVIILVLDKAGTVQSINQKGCDMIGYVHEEVVGKNWFDRFVPPRISDNVKATYLSMVSGKSEFLAHYEIPVVTRSGEERVIAWNNTPLKDDGGHIIGVLSSGNDLTDRKKVEDSLRESQRALSTMMSNLSGMVYRCRRDQYWTMEFVSEGCLELTGYSPSDLILSSKIAYSQLVHSEDRARVWSTVQEALKLSKPFQVEYRIFTADRKLKWVWEQGRGVPSSEGKIEMVEGFITDISQRKQMEEELKKSEESFRKLAENASDVIFLYDLNKGYEYVSPASEKIMGYTPEEYYEDKNLAFKIVHPDDALKLAAVNDQISRQRSPAHAEIRWRHKNGRVVWTEQINIPIFNEKGDLVAIEGIVRDITERKQIEGKKRVFEDRLSALNFYGMTINAARSVQEVYQLTVEAIERALGFEHAMFLVIEGDHLKIVYQRGLNSLLDRLPLDGSKRGLTVKAATTRRTVLVHDVWKDRDYVEGIPGIRSELAVPVEIEGRVIGVLDVQSKKVGAFDERDVKLIQILASHAAIAISNKERQAEIEKRSTQLSSLMASCAEMIQTTDLRQRIQKIAEAIRKLGWRRVVISLRDENLNILNPDDIISAGLTDEEKSFLWKSSPSGKVWRERLGPEYRRFKIGQFYYLPWSDPWVRQKFSDNTVASRVADDKMVDWDPQDLLYAPLTTTEGRIVGILSIDDPIDGRRPTRESLAPLELFINQAAVAIENARLIQQLNNARNQIREYAEGLEQKVQQRTQELLETQDKLIKSERLAAIGEIAAMVGHDLRNPLQVIVYTLYLTNEMLKKVSPETRKSLEESHVDELLERIGEQVNYMDKIISDLQDYSMPLKPVMVGVDLSKLIASTLSSLTIPSNVKIVNRIPEDFPQVMVDSSMMRRVFSNLFINAVQAMPDGGELEISSSISDDMVTINVRDTGIGIPKENIEKLFQPLFTTKSKGQGFGLAVCKRLVEAHGGTIYVVSELSKGSTFTIKLPIGKLKYSQNH